MTGITSPQLCSWSLILSGIAWVCWDVSRGRGIGVNRVCGKLGDGRKGGQSTVGRLESGSESRRGIGRSGRELREDANTSMHQAEL